MARGCWRFECDCEDELPVDDLLPGAFHSLDTVDDRAKRSRDLMNKLLVAAEARVHAGKKIGRNQCRAWRRAVCACLTSFLPVEMRVCPMHAPPLLWLPQLRVGGGLDMVAVSETPHNDAWKVALNTRVPVRELAKQSSLHIYCCIMLRVARIVGLSKATDLGAAQREVDKAVAATPPALPAAGAPLAVEPVQGTLKSGMGLEDWRYLTQTTRRAGQLYGVTRPHGESSRQTWMLWEDTPKSFQRDYDYITPRQQKVI